MSETIKIYLAGPAYFEEDEGQTWRRKAEQMIKTATDDKEANVITINPMDFFSYSEHKHQSDTQVKRYYMDQIAHSRLILVNLDHTRTSPGTLAELQFAADHDIPIIAFCTDDEVYPWAKCDAQVVFSSLLSAIDYIADYYC